MIERALPTVLICVVLIACGGGGSNPQNPAVPSTTDISPSTTAISPPTTDISLSTTTTTPSTTRPPTSPVPEALTAASTAFEEWVGHLGRGDHEAAWESMAETSQVAVGEELFFDSLVFAMSEGWGSWSAAEDVSYRLGEDDAGRTLLWVSGTVSTEGMTEHRELAIPIVAGPDGYLMSPFEEFGNVAEGIEEEIAGTPPPPVPTDSGNGRRVVYSNSDQRVWLIDEEDTVVDSYLVSGKAGVPEPATYQVYSRSEVAYAGHDDITMRYMVRFAHGENLPIGFHPSPTTPPERR